MWLFPLILACSGDPETPAPEVGAGVATERPPNIVLVAIDTLRADHLSTFGYGRPTSPNLDALAARGSRFTRAYAQSGWTLASFTSLLTGLYPHEHRVGRDSVDVSRFGRLPEERVTLAEALKAQGYRTAAVVSNTFVAPEFKLNQGFDLYDYKGATNDEHRAGTEAISLGLDWLDEGGEQPSFLWLHFMEPHLDYDPPEEFEGEKVKGTFWDQPAPSYFDASNGVPNGLGWIGTGPTQLDEVNLAYTQARYDEEILLVDKMLGKLVAGLDDRKAWDNTLFVLTADHGEEFWDHGAFEHGHALFGELTRVPLVVVGPGVPEGRTVTTLVEHMDVFRAMVEAGGAEPPAGSHGEDIRAIARDRPDERGRSALSENVIYGPPKVSLVTDTHRLVIDQSQGTGQVWEVAADGSELVRVGGQEQGALAEPMVAQLRAMRGGSLDPIMAVAGPRSPSYETFKQLAELGYLDDLPEEDKVPEGPQ